MLEKIYQKVFTQTLFKECQFLWQKENSLIISNKSKIYGPTQNFQPRQDSSVYNTYIVNQQQVITLPNLRIFDTKVTKIQNTDSRAESQLFLDNLVCGQVEVNNNLFSRKYKDYFDGSIVSLIDQNSHKSAIMTSSTSLRINQQKDRLYLQSFKRNQEHYDILNNLSKSKTIYIQKKAYQVLVLDINQTSFNNLRLKNLSVVNEQEVLLQLGLAQQQQKNFLLYKFDITKETFQWKHSLNRLSTFFGRNVHITQNSFLNGIYDFDNHDSILQLFDYRMKGPALTVLNPEIPQFADFNHLERIDGSFKLISLFTQRGGASNQPFILDIRYPQHFQIVKFKNSQNKLPFAKKIKYQKPYLFTIQSQYQSYKFKQAKVVKFNFTQP